MRKNISSSLTAFTLIVLLATLGCSGAGSEHGHVTGTLTINGSPVEEAVVTFAPVEGGRSAVAVTKADGTYELNYTPGVKGAKVGNNSVRITTYVAPELDDNNRVVTPAKPERLPPKYSRGEELKVEVKPGENTFDFAVEADKDKYPPPPQ